MQCKRIDLRERQLPVGLFIQERFFIFDETNGSLAEPMFGWSTTLRELDGDPNRSLYRIADCVRIVQNTCNATTNPGTIEAVIWSEQLGVWQYALVDDLGRRNAKLYDAPDLIAVRRSFDEPTASP
jgi:hypothetical protein